MRNLVLNVTATGGWQSLGAAEGFPQRTYYAALQARDAQADMYYRYRGQTTYWTVKSGDVRILPENEYWPADIEVQAAQGVVMEIELSTRVE